MNFAAPRRTILSTIAISTLALTAGPATATQLRRADGPPEQHCVVTVTDETGGVLTTGPETCFETKQKVDDYIRGTSVAARSASNTIGTHYTDTYSGGSSITIVGTTCTGGVWWPTGSWNNNIESSAHQCGASATRFYDSSSCSGTGTSIYGYTSTLNSMNNKTSCVRYG